MADIVRPMQAMDIDRVYELERTCFRTPWSRQSLKDELTNSIAHYLVFERDKTVIAYAGMWIIYDEAHITNVAVDPDFRRQGIAKRVMLCMMRTARLFDATQMTLEVRENNFGAQALYAQLDFEKAGVRKGYYTDTGEAAYIMWNSDIGLTLSKSNVSIG